MSDESKQITNLQLAIKVIIYYKNQKAIENNENDNKERWAFLGIGTGRSSNVDQSDNAITKEIIKTIGNNTNLEKLFSVGENIKQHIQKWNNQSKIKRIIDAQSIYKKLYNSYDTDEIKKLNATIFLHQHENLKHEDCFICDMYRNANKDPVPTQDASTVNQSTVDLETEKYNFLKLTVSPSNIEEFLSIVKSLPTDSQSVIQNIDIEHIEASSSDIIMMIQNYKSFEDKFKVTRKKKQAANDTGTYYYKIITEKLENHQSLKDVGSWVNHIDIIQQLLQIKWIEDPSAEETTNLNQEFSNFSGYPLRLSLIHI